MLSHTSTMNIYLVIVTTFFSLVMVFLVLVLFMTRRKKTKSTSHKEAPIDFEAIAGEDVITTQLDLARAYLEMDNKQSAHSILKNVIKRGNGEQKIEARQLIAEIS
jgi:FimV-like protein